MCAYANFRPFSPRLCSLARVTEYTDGVLAKSFCIFRGRGHLAHNYLSRHKKKKNRSLLFFIERLRNRRSPLQLQTARGTSETYSYDSPLNEFNDVYRTISSGGFPRYYRTVSDSFCIYWWAVICASSPSNLINSIRNRSRNAPGKEKKKPQRLLRIRVG